MDLNIVNPKVKYQPVKLIDPPPLGYLHIGALVAPTLGRTPFPRRSQRRTELLSRLKTLAGQLEQLETVEKATVYRATVIPPPSREARQGGVHVARYDVAVLVETVSPEVLDEVQASQPYRELLDAVTGASTDHHVMTARCVRRVGDVDKTRQGTFLFNHFTAEDAEVARQAWDYLAGWYAVETDMDNSTLLEPVGTADYVFVNHARWDVPLPVFMVRQFSKRTFRTYMLANLRTNRMVAMPVLYRLA